MIADSNRHKTLTVAAAAALLAAGLAVSLWIGDAGAQDDNQRAELLGKTNRTADPLCPQPCSVTATVTGFQSKVQGEEKPFQVRRDGRIVAWAVQLGKPNKEDRKFFEENLGSRSFGNGPVARISILKKKGKGRFKLVKQGPATNVSSFFNNRGVITLTDPLRVRKGQTVALTVPTWLPDLVPPGDAPQSLWRASRPASECNSGSAADARPQQKVGSVREYGCFFSDRLLYWAYFVPKGG